MDVARSYDGLQEVKGKGSNPTILGWLQGPGKGKWAKDDATPWCGAAMAGVFTESGLGHIVPATPLRARSWADVGVPLDGPRIGCIAVIPRHDANNPDAAHVALVEGFTATTLTLRGGNQRDRFGVDEFRRLDEEGHDRALAYRWPVPIKTAADLAADGSRIASRAKRVERDTAISATSGTSPQTAPAITEALPPMPRTGLRQTIDGLVGDLTWLKSIFSTLADFAVFTSAKWPVAAVVVAGYFGGRVLWDTYMIKEARVADNNEGYTAL
jgi:uncharacterized protein (TIGR02594 family)